MCEHDIQRRYCKDCHGTGICEHNKNRRICPICDSNGHLTGILRCRLYSALGKDRDSHTLQDLGCDIITFKHHIENQFKLGMTWDNHGEWHIDHIIPLLYHGPAPTKEIILQRFHYTNTQPLWKPDNIKKGNHYIG